MSWLLPCVELTCLTLALGSVLRLEIAAMSFATGWLTLVLLPLLADRAPVVLDRQLPLLWSSLIVGSLTVLYLRRSAFQRVTLRPKRS